MKIKSEIKLLNAAFECARSVGIYEKSCFGFGTVLGAIRPTLRTDKVPAYYTRGLMQHDHDSDICLLNLTREEKENYFRACKDAGLFKWTHPHTPKERVSRKPDGEILWFSIVEPKEKARCCQWMCYDYGGYLWHTKGKRWLGKFDKKKYSIKSGHQAIAKGTLSKYYRELTEIDFEGMKANIPLMSGSLLDDWYGGWAVPKKSGASRKKVVCVIGDWNNQKTWRIT